MSGSHSRYSLQTETQDHWHRSPETSPYKTWTLTDGSVWAEFFREGENGYRVCFPGIASFSFALPISGITCSPEQGTDAATVQHLYLNQVLPLARSMEGRLILHASAVDIGGRSVLFTGLSGRGKSTLSTYFAKSGHLLISDDGVVFAENATGFQIEPGHPSVRLWSDSRDALLGDGVLKESRAIYSDKSRVLTPEGISFCKDPGAVAAVLHLGPPSQEDIEIERLGRRDALAECLPHLFLLDDRDPAILATHFDQLAALANGVPQYRLHFPRRYDILEPLRARIVDRLLHENTAIRNE